MSGIGKVFAHRLFTHLIRPSEEERKRKRREGKQRKRKGDGKKRGENIKQLEEAREWETKKEKRNQGKEIKEKMKEEEEEEEERKKRKKKGIIKERKNSKSIKRKHFQVWNINSKSKAKQCIANNANIWKCSLVCVAQ